MNFGFDFIRPTPAGSNSAVTTSTTSSMPASAAITRGWHDDADRRVIPAGETLELELEFVQEELEAVKNRAAVPRAADPEPEAPSTPDS